MLHRALLIRLLLVLVVLLAALDRVPISPVLIHHLLVIMQLVVAVVMATQLHKPVAAVVVMVVLQVPEVRVRPDKDSGAEILQLLFQVVRVLEAAVVLLKESIVEVVRALLGVLGTLGLRMPLNTAAAAGGVRTMLDQAPAAQAVERQVDETAMLQVRLLLTVAAAAGAGIKTQQDLQAL
jgi:hypothetical protein